MFVHLGHEIFSDAFQSALQRLIGVIKRLGLRVDETVKVKPATSTAFRRYLKMAVRLAPTLRDKRLHPHSLRHSTAVALLKAVVDFATISQWLGHAGLNTTMRYARADIDLKRQALSQAFPDALAPPRGGRLLIDGSDLVGWMRRI